jgi:hypothetical protein
MFFAHIVPNFQNLLKMCKGSASRFTETGLWKQHADRIYRARFAELPSASKGTFAKSSVPHLIEPGVIVTGRRIYAIDDRANKRENITSLDSGTHTVSLVSLRRAGNLKPLYLS